MRRVWFLMSSLLLLTLLSCQGEIASDSESDAEGHSEHEESSRELTKDHLQEAMLERFQERYADWQPHWLQRLINNEALDASVSEGATPKGDYVIFYSRAFSGDKFVILYLDAQKVEIYSSAATFRHTHAMSEAEHKEAMALLTSQEVQDIPINPANTFEGITIVSDGFEFSDYGILNGEEFKFHHVEPEDPAVLALYDLYRYYRNKGS